MDVDSVRHDLKHWEAEFFATHGRKPTREDSRLNKDIWSKYRQYNQFRRSASALPSSQTPQKSSTTHWTTATVQQLKKPSAEVTSAALQHGEVLSGGHADIELPFEDEAALTPVFIRCALGPTPQKDGIVLGLFDMLHSTARAPPLGTPTKGEATLDTVTPSGVSSRAMSPQSAPSDRQFCVDTCGTPLKRKRGGSECEDDSTINWAYATPSFLRRSTRSGQGQRFEPSMQAPPSKRDCGGFQGSLSSALHRLRRLEKPALNDKSESTSRSVAVPDTVMTPSRSVEEGGITTSDVVLGSDRGGSGSLYRQRGFPDRGAWKRKAPKRQTKRIRMKPVLHKPQKASDFMFDGDKSSSMEYNCGHTGPSALQPKSMTFDVEGKLRKISEGEARQSSTAGDGGIRAHVSTKASSTSHPNFRKLKIKAKAPKARRNKDRYRAG